MATCTPLSRRRMLASSVAGIAAVSSATTNCPLATSASSPQRDDVGAGWIDAHSHIWTPDTSRFALQPGIAVDDLQPRSFTDDELMAVAGLEGVDRVVLIQHTVFHGFDNSYLIDAWRRHPKRFRIVGMVDDLRPHSGRAMRQLLLQGVTGFRIAPRKGITDWLQTDGMTEMWTTAAETGQAMCCLINPHNLPEVDAACRRHPQTPVVIDHFARVGIDGTVRDSDVAALCALAKHARVSVKVSAYYALGAKRPPYHDLIPMIKRLFEAFGPDRLMWASDCPYQLDGDNTYAASIGLIRDTVDFLTDEDRRKLLQSTAERVFFFA